MRLIVDYSDLDRVIRKLDNAELRIMRSGLRWVRKLTGVAERKMKLYSSSRTSRSTGALSSSIQSNLKVGGRTIRGTAYVPKNIEYQFAAEYGFRIRKKMGRGKYMKFPVSAWKKARLSPKVGRGSVGGHFIFYGVMRGRYKGKAYRKRAFEKVLSYYNAHKKGMANGVARAIIFG